MVWICFIDRMSYFWSLIDLIIDWKKWNYFSMYYFDFNNYDFNN